MIMGVFCMSSGYTAGHYNMQSCRLVPGYLHKTCTWHVLWKHALNYWTTDLTHFIDKPAKKTQVHAIFSRRTTKYVQWWMLMNHIFEVLSFEKTAVRSSCRPCPTSCWDDSLPSHLSSSDSTTSEMISDHRTDLESHCLSLNVHPLTSLNPVFLVFCDQMSQNVHDGLGWTGHVYKWW